MGKRTGFWVEYFKNGKLWNKGSYKDGEREGLWVEYHDHGVLAKAEREKNSRVDEYLYGPGQP